MSSPPPDVPELPPEPTPVLSTGVPSLDAALGIGGWPLGRLVEVLGPTLIGKTTLALHAVAAVQARGAQAVFVDADRRLDPTWAEACGVNLRRMILAQPDQGDQALDIVEAMVRSGAVPLVVIDSVAGLGASDEPVGTLARRMSKAMRALVSLAGKTQTTVLFTNPLRAKAGATFGPHEVTEGGNALKYYASARVVLRPTELGVCATVVKNTHAPRFTQAVFRLDAGPEEDATSAHEGWVELGRAAHRSGRAYDSCRLDSTEALAAWQEGWSGEALGRALLNPEST